MELENYKWIINLVDEYLMTKYLYTVKDKVTPHKLTKQKRVILQQRNLANMTLTKGLQLI